MELLFSDIPEVQNNYNLVYKINYRPSFQDQFYLT